MTGVAILGTEGAGKTVLVSCLVKYVQSLGEGYALDPQSTAAQTYVDQVWRRLRGGEWPPATPPGQLPLLEWTLHLPELPPRPFRLIDPPGHDIRRLFSEDASLANVPPELQPLAEILFASDIILLLINLADFLGEADEQRKAVSELAVKFVLDALARRQPAPFVALVFTQADRYPQAFREPFNPQALLAEYLPHVFQVVLHQQSAAGRGIIVWAVSAVNRTRTVLEGQRARQVPAPDFQSEGLEHLVAWIHEEAIPWPATVVTRWWPQAHGLRRAALALSGIDVKTAWRWLKFIGIVLVCLVLLRGCTATPRPQLISPQGRYHYIRPFDYDVEVTGRVRNNGAAGMVTVYAGLRCNQQQWMESQKKHLAAGETAEFRLWFRSYSMGSASYAIGTTPEAVRNSPNYHPVWE